MLRLKNGKKKKKIRQISYISCVLVGNKCKDNCKTRWELFFLFDASYIRHFTVNKFYVSPNNFSTTRVTLQVLCYLESSYRSSFVISVGMYSKSLTKKKKKNLVWLCTVVINCACWWRRSICRHSDGNVPMWHMYGNDFPSFNCVIINS